MKMIKLYSVLSYAEKFELKKIIDEEIESNNKLVLSEFIKVYNLKQSLGKIDYKHIPREKNKRADQLVNEALDKNI